MTRPFLELVIAEFQHHWDALDCDPAMAMAIAFMYGLNAGVRFPEWGAWVIAGFEGEGGPPDRNDWPGVITPEDIVEAIADIERLEAEAMAGRGTSL